MATKVDIARTSISAPQMSEFFRLAGIPGSHVNGTTLQEFLECRNPFATEQNLSNLDQFFQTRSGLCVEEIFRQLVLTKAKSGTVRKMKHINLPHNMPDAEVEKRFGTGRIWWDEGDLCVTLKRIIEKQWSGRNGVLLSNGFANIFYTSSCVVRVYWSAFCRGWCVSAGQRGSYGWGAGDRVFSTVREQS